MASKKKPNGKAAVKVKPMPKKGSGKKSKGC